MAAEEGKGAVPEGLAAAPPPAFKKRVAAGKNFRRRGKEGGWGRYWGWVGWGGCDGRHFIPVVERPRQSYHPALRALQ